MNRIQLVTSNPSKVNEYNRYAEDLGASTIFTIKNVNIPEIQSENLDLVLLGKLNYVARLTSLPFIVEDTIFITERYKDFPGTYVKFINNSLGIEGWKKLFQEGDKIDAITRIGLSHLDQKYFFEGRLEGTISFKNTNIADVNAPLNTIFYVPQNDDFLGNLIKINSFENHRKKAFKALFQFLINIEDQETFKNKEIKEKWDSRAKTWEKTLKDKSAPINFENGYTRFLSVLEKFIPIIVGSVLDIGTGIGTIARTIAKNSSINVLGIDISNEMIKQAEKYHRQKNLSFLRGSIETLSTETKFNFIVTRGILVSQLSINKIVDFFERVTDIAADGCYFMFDFIQDKDRGSFPSETIANLNIDDVERVLRELGWVKVYQEDSLMKRVGIIVFHKPAPDGIYFATSNPLKIAELQNELKRSTKQIYFYGIEIDEIKSDSIERIVVEKLKKSYEIIKRPVLCTDGGIFIDALKGFPGENSKQAAQTIGAGGILKLLDGADTRRAIRRNCMGYFDGNQIKSELAEIECRISDQIREKYPSYEFDKILIPTKSGNPMNLTYSEISLELRTGLTELPQLASFIDAL